MSIVAEINRWRTREVTDGGEVETTALLFSLQHIRHTMNVLSIAGETPTVQSQSVN